MKMYIFLSTVFLLFIYCSNFCNVYDIQEIDNLTGDKSIIAWVTKCGATGQNSISVSWKEENMNLEKMRGKIFEASRGENIKIEKISSDTIRINYFALNIEKKKEKLKGIVFIYKGRKLDYFKKNN
jgi:hypothetical protein